MKNKIIPLFIFLFLISSVSADRYNDCSIYGNCKPVVVGNGQIIYNNTYNNFTIINGSSYNVTYQNDRISTSNVTINSGIKFWYNQTEEAFYYINSNYSALLLNATATYLPYNGANKNVNLNGVNLSGVGTYASNNTLASGIGSAVFGSVRTANSSMNATGVGSFASGDVNSIGGYILSSGLGSFSRGIISSVNGSIIASSTASVAIGAIQGTGNNTITSGGFGSVTFGRNAGINSMILNGGRGSFMHGQINGGSNNLITAGFSRGSFVHGSIESSSSYANNTIVGTSNGNFVHGYIPDGISNSRIEAVGEGAVAIGLSNMSILGIGSIGMGRNINVTGTNVFAFGTSSTFKLVQGSNQFWTDALVNATAGIITNNLTTTGLNVTSYISGTGNISATADGTMAFGTTTGIQNSSISASSVGSLAIGAIRTTSTNSYISSANVGTNTFGYIAGSTNSFILNDGTASKVFGAIANSPNSSIVSNTGAFVNAFINGPDRTRISTGAGTFNNIYLTGLGLDNSVYLPGGGSTNLITMLGGNRNNISSGSTNVGGNYISLILNQPNDAKLFLKDNSYGTKLFGNLDTNGGYIEVQGWYNTIFGRENISVNGTNNFIFGSMLNITNSTNSFIFGNPTTITSVSIYNQLWTNTYLNVSNNASVEQLFRVGLSVALPACNVASNLSVGRNLTGLYDCVNGNGTWMKL